MTWIAWVLAGAALCLACLAQTYRTQRDDLAAFIVYSGILEESEE